MTKKSAYSAAFDEIFKKLMTGEGLVPPGTEQMESIRGTERSQWAFPEGQMNPVNVTPFQDRPLKDQKILGDLLASLYGHGAGYETAEAQKVNAAANAVSAGAQSTNAATNRKGLDELLKRNTAENASAVTAGEDDNYVGMPPWAPKVNQPTNRVAVPTGTARTTGAGAVTAGSMNFEITPEKLAALGATPNPQDKKKKKTGNPWIDGGYSTMK